MSAARALENDSVAAVFAGLDLDAAADLGRSYLAAYPGDREIAPVLQLLDASSESPEAIADRLGELARADFANDRTANLRGWIVSRTEGRVLGALAELSSAERDRR